MRLTLARAVAAFRVAMLLLAAGLAAHSWDAYAHPGVAVVVLTLMAGWTVVASVPVAGLVAGPVAVGLRLADVVERGAPTAANANSAILVIVAGGDAGFVSRLLRQVRVAEARAVAAEAADAERSRLAADIHDSVLQVLALVARRGGHAGGEAAELARLAGEQEAVLRGLVGAPTAAGADGSGDLRALLLAQARNGVEVAAPATAVPLKRSVAQAISAAVAAALDNVTAHAGAGARAWVLLDDDGQQVQVSVRDDGAGIPAGRLERAAAEGRLGVAASIRRRVERVGGSVTISATPGAGTEVEIVVRR